MKMKRLAFAVLMLCALLCASPALAEKNRTTEEINLTFDGVTFTDTVQVEWEERYIVPEGGVKWDGTEDFVAYDIGSQSNIVELENESYYVEGQIIFTAKLDSAFQEIERIVAEQGAKIIGYIALTNSYAIEAVEDKSYNNLQRIITELQKETDIYEDSVCLNYAYESKAEAYKITDPWQYDFAPPLTQEDWVGRSELQNMGAYNWRAIAVNAPKAWNYIDYMRQTNVGVIDATFPEKHPDIDYALVDDEYYQKGIRYSAGIFASDEKTNDEANHGTIIAGIIAAKHNQTGIGGIYPKGKIVAVGVFGKNNRKTFITGYTETCAFAECINNGARVINISLGWATPHEIVNKKEIDAVYNEFFENLRRREKEFLIVAAAGNVDNDTEKSVYLAHIENEYFQNRFVIVSGLQWGEEGPTFRDGLCWGARVDILAPASMIFSTCLKNYQKSGREYMHDIRGTSFAAPHVAGVAAMMWSIKPSLSGSQIKKKILSHGEKVTVGTKGGIFTYPTLDAYACVQDVLRIGTICGKIIIDLGVENVEIEVIQYDEYVTTVVSGRNGEFTIDLPIGEYKLKACIEGYNSVEKQVDVTSGNDVFIIFDMKKESYLTDKGKLVCTVSDQTVNAPINASIAVIPDKEGEAITIIDEIGDDGILEMDLEEGTYRIQIGKEGYIGYSNTVTINKNEKTFVNALLEWNNDGTLIELPGYYFTYDIVNNEHVIITGYIGPTDVDLVIPSYIANLPVKDIADYSFFDRTDLAGKILLPNMLERIGAYAFGSFSEWMQFSGELIIPDSVTSIGQGAFCNGNYTGKLVLSKNLTEIPQKAFAYCYSFSEELVIPPSIKRIDDLAFAGYGSSSIVAGGGYAIEISGDLEYVGYYAITGCKTLRVKGDVSYKTVELLGQYTSQDTMIESYAGSNAQMYAKNTGRGFIENNELR